MAWLLKLSVLLHLSLILLGVIKLCWEEYFKLEMRMMKTKLRSLQDDGTLILFELISIHNLTVHVFGMYRVKRILKSPFNIAISFDLKCWLFMAIESLVFDIFKLLLSLNLCQTLLTEAENILMKSIEMYNFDVYWNVLWNQIQLSNSCCGVKLYKDWRNIIWTNLEHELLYNRLLHKNKTLVPSSCCQSHNVCNIAFPNTNRHNGGFIDINDIESVGVFQSGCLYPFIENVTSTMGIGLLIMVSSIVIQPVAMAFNRILFLKNRIY